MRSGNDVRVLIDRDPAEVQWPRRSPQHSILTTGWTADPAFQLGRGSAATSLGELLAARARGVRTRVLLWRGPSDS